MYIYIYIWSGSSSGFCVLTGNLRPEKDVCIVQPALRCVLPGALLHRAGYRRRTWRRRCRKSRDPGRYAPTFSTSSISSPPKPLPRG